MRHGVSSMVLVKTPDVLNLIEGKFVLATINLVADRIQPALDQLGPEVRHDTAYMRKILKDIESRAAFKIKEEKVQEIGWIPERRPHDQRFHELALPAAGRADQDGVIRVHAAAGFRQEIDLGFFQLVAVRGQADRKLKQVFRLVMN